MLYDIPEELHSRNRAKEKSVVLGCGGVGIRGVCVRRFQAAELGDPVFRVFGDGGG